MKLSNGKIIAATGILHVLFGLTPLAFYQQAIEFSRSFFFNISNGLWEFPLFNGTMNFENFAVFWFLYFGLLLIPLGILLHVVEEQSKGVPKAFIYSYLALILAGIYMIPFSGMTFFMLPHALYMLFNSRRKTQRTIQHSS